MYVMYVNSFVLLKGWKKGSLRMYQKYPFSLKSLSLGGRCKCLIDSCLIWGQRHNTNKQTNKVFTLVFNNKHTLFVGRF